MTDYPTPFYAQWVGGHSTIYPAASLGRSTSPTDTPADTYVPGKINGPINYGIELFGGIEPSASGSGGIGVITLIDPDGELDSLIALAWDGAELEILRGPPLAEFSTYEVVAKVTTAGIVYNQRKKELRVRDLGWRMVQAELHGERYTGIGGIDGEEALAGKMKPYAAGPFYNAEPILLNTTLLIYQVSFTSILAIDAARDGGLALTFQADYATYADLAAATISAAHYGTCLAEGLLRLGSTIAVLLTIDGRGDNDSPDGQTYPHTRAQIARRIATGYGPIKLGDYQIDYQTINYMEQEQPATVGFYWSEATTKADALTRVMSGCLGWWAIRTNGLLALGFMRKPMGAPALVLNYPEDFGNAEPEMMQGYQTPRKATYVGWRRNNTLQDASRLAGGVDQAAALLFRTPLRYASFGDQFVNNTWSTAPSVYIDGEFWEEVDALAEATRQQALMGTRRERWVITAPCDPFSDLELLGNSFALA